MLIRSRAPLRLGLAGGGTDVPPYCDEHGGLVFSASIDKYAYATWETAKGKLLVESRDLKITREIKNVDDYSGDMKLINATLKVMKLKIGKHGGKISLWSDALVGSGLGASSAVNVGLIGVLWRGMGLTADKPLTEQKTRYEIANLAYIIERKELKIAGGYQDQYISAYGGLCLIEKKPKKEGIFVTPLRIHDDAISELESSILLCDIMKPREGGNIIKEQQEAYKRGANIESLHKMKALVDLIKTAVLNGDVAEFGRYLHESWMLKKETAIGTSNNHIDNIYSHAMKTGKVYGGKISGAGGGGHLMLVCNPIYKRDVMKSLEGSVEFKEFSFEKKGLSVWRA